LYRTRIAFCDRKCVVRRNHAVLTTAALQPMNASTKRWHAWSSYTRCWWCGCHCHDAQDNYYALSARYCQ